MIEDKILTEAEAAKYLKLKTETLSKLRRKGEGPPYSRIGGSIRYSKKTLEDWFKSQERRRS